MSTIVHTCFFFFFKSLLIFSLFLFYYSTLILLNNLFCRRSVFVMYARVDHFCFQRLLKHFLEKKEKDQKKKWGKDKKMFLSSLHESHLIEWNTNIESTKNCIVSSKECRISAKPIENSWNIPFPNATCSNMKPKEPENFYIIFFSCHSLRSLSSVIISFLLLLSWSSIPFLSLPF